MDSADQDQWVELAELARADLARRSKNISSFSNDELHMFICCCRDAFTNEINSKSFDKKLEKAVSSFTE